MTILAAGPWSPLAVLRLREGDSMAIAPLCAEMLQRFGAATPPKHRRARWLCTAISRRRWSIPDAAARAGADAPSRSAAKSSLSCWPSGPPSTAPAGTGGRRDARRVDSGPPRSPCVRVQAGLFLAMAHHRLGRVEEARRALAEADRLLAEHQANPRRSILPGNWDWRDETFCLPLRAGGRRDPRDRGPTRGGRPGDRDPGGRAARADRSGRGHARRGRGSDRRRTGPTHLTRDVRHRNAGTVSAPLEGTMNRRASVAAGVVLPSESPSTKGQFPMLHSTRTREAVTLPTSSRTSPSPNPHREDIPIPAADFQRAPIKGIPYPTRGIHRQK